MTPDFFWLLIREWQAQEEARVGWDAGAVSIGWA
jgi:hypothetical protein